MMMSWREKHECLSEFPLGLVIKAVFISAPRAKDNVNHSNVMLVKTIPVALSENIIAATHTADRVQRATVRSWADALRS